MVIVVNPAPVGFRQISLILSNGSELLDRLLLKFLFELRIGFHLQLFSGIGTEIIRCLQKFASVIRKLQAGNIFICQFRLRVCIDSVDGHFKDDRLACQVGGAVVLGESQIQRNGLALLVADQAIVEAFDAHDIRTDFQMQALIASIVIFLSVHFSDVIDVDDVAFPYICPICDFCLDLVIGHDLLDTVFHILIRDFPFPGHFNRQGGVVTDCHIIRRVDKHNIGFIGICLFFRR